MGKIVGEPAVLKTPQAGRSDAAAPEACAEAKALALYCSFCRKPHEQAGRLVAGPAVFICEVCVAHCAEILAAAPDSEAGACANLCRNGQIETEALLALLAGMEATAQDVRARVQATIDLLRQRAVSWEKIGRALGCSRQAAWERFG